MNVCHLRYNLLINRQEGKKERTQTAQSVTGVLTCRIWYRIWLKKMKLFFYYFFTFCTKKIVAACFKISLYTFNLHFTRAYVVYMYMTCILCIPVIFLSILSTTVSVLHATKNLFHSTQVSTQVTKVIKVFLFRMTPMHVTFPKIAMSHIIVRLNDVFLLNLVKRIKHFTGWTHVHEIFIC